MNFCKVFSIILFVLSQSAYATPISPQSQQLLNLTMNRSPHAPAMTVDQVKSLIAQGADIGVRNAGGEYPFLLATETLAYFNAEKDPRAASTQAVAEYLMSIGSDISSVDGRGLSPLAYLLSYSPDLTLANEIIAQKPNFNVPNPTGRTPLYALTERRDSNFYPFFETVMSNLSSFNGSVDAVDENGISPVMSAAATQTVDGNGVLILQRYLESVPVPRRSVVADLPDHSGTSPLMGAILLNRFKSVAYLLANYPVDVNRVNTDGETPLSLAIQSGNAALVTQLESMGAIPPSQNPAPLSCTHANNGPFTFDTLMDLVFSQCGYSIRGIDDLLPLLPNSLRSHYTLMYATQGLAKANPMSPRPILHGKDAKLVIAFGDKIFDDPNQETLELYTFDDTKKQFNFYELDFPKNKKPVLSEANPAQCKACHGSPARPIWNSWTLWPGAYFGDMQELNSGTGERQDYEAFQARVKNDPHSRYRSLLPHAVSPVRSEFGNYLNGITSFTVDTNLSLDFLISSLMGQRISAEIASQPALMPLRYAILAALSCKDDVTNYMPTSTQASLPRTEVEIQEETNALANEEMQSRFTQQAAVRPGSLGGRYNIELSTPGLYPYIPPTVGMSGDPIRVTKLRYLIEGTLGDGAMSSWFTPFNANRPSYVAVDLSDIEARVWKLLLDPVVDADLLTLYTSVQNKITISQVTTWIYDQGLPIQSQLCSALKTKALNQTLVRQ